MSFAVINLRDYFKDNRPTAVTMATYRQALLKALDIDPLASEEDLAEQFEGTMTDDDLAEKFIESNGDGKSRQIILNLETMTVIG